LAGWEVWGGSQGHRQGGMGLKGIKTLWSDAQPFCGSSGLAEANRAEVGISNDRRLRLVDTTVGTHPARGTGRRVGADDGNGRQGGGKVNTVGCPGSVLLQAELGTQKAWITSRASIRNSTRLAALDVKFAADESPSGNGKGRRTEEPLTSTGKTPMLPPESKHRFSRGGGSASLPETRPLALSAGESSSHAKWTGESAGIMPPSGIDVVAVDAQTTHDCGDGGPEDFPS